MLIEHIPPNTYKRMLDGAYDRKLMERPQYFIESYNGPIFRVVAEYDKSPALATGESVDVTLRFVNKVYRPENYVNSYGRDEPAN